MIAADKRHTGAAKLLVVEADGRMRHLPRAALGMLFRPGDLVIANDAATLPASLYGEHVQSGAPVELRLAAWTAWADPSRFVAVVFGAGDHRLRTEDRPAPPSLPRGSQVKIGSLVATVEAHLDHARLLSIRFHGDRPSVLAGLAGHGRPIQYAHVQQPLALWDVWTRTAAAPIAFEPPSAGFALNWRTIHDWRRRGVGFATVTHAAGISSTGERQLDKRLPLDERYCIPQTTLAMIEETKARSGQIIAIGTTVVRALESAALPNGRVAAGFGLAQGRIARATRLNVVDAILSGVHQPGDSHFDLLRAFADDAVLARMSAALLAHDYRSHEFGDSVLMERQLGTSKALASR